MAREGILLGMGNPLLDISANVPKDMLAKYGLEKNNAILAEEKHQPIYEELCSNYDAEYIPGGATQNGIRVCQWILQDVPRACTFIGCVGNDDYARRMKERAEKDLVRPQYMVDATTPTGTCAVLVNGPHRSLVANLAAANNYKVEHIQKAENWAIVESAQYFYMAGFFLTVSPQTIQLVAQHAAENNKWFIMNLSAPFLCQFFKDPMMAAAPYWDIVFGNETEALQFAKENNFGTEDLHEIAKKMQAMPKVNSKRPRTVVITQGRFATIVCENGATREYPVDILPVEQIVDTNAAGDAFVGGFLAQLIKGKSIDECVRCGHWSAKVVIQHSGCTFPAKCDFA